MILREKPIWIVTGPRGTGKTRFCKNLAQKAKEHNIQIAGIICPPVFEKGEKIAIQIENVKTQEARLLATINTKGETDSVTCRWVFNKESLRWGSKLLHEATPCELLFVDELGPLEFELHQGWQEGLQAIDESRFQAAIVVIRPELVKTALSRWPEAVVLEIPLLLDQKEERELQNKILNSIP